MYITHLKVSVTVSMYPQASLSLLPKAVAIGNSLKNLGSRHSVHFVNPQFELYTALLSANVVTL